MDVYIEMLKDVGIFLKEDEKEKMDFKNLDSNEEEFGLDYEQELHLKLNGRKTHHYDRCYRFRWTFSHLIANNGCAPKYLLVLLNARLNNNIIHGRKCYEEVRKILKELKSPKLYLSIPLIIKCLGKNLNLH